MLINADFSRRAIVTADEYRWAASPQRGVERVMLDRFGGEQARATSIVRYAPNACFPRHQHLGGEEILVLSGTFSEDGADYPAGWYLRNPPGSSHEPFSNEGAVIFVKLWQMAPDENRRVRIDTRDPASWQRRDSREVCPLFSHGSEQVRLLRLASGETLLTEPVGGTELLVLDGGLAVGGRAYDRGTWMRLPAGESLEIVGGAQGATLYLKTGHLAGV